jgi:hypothetical protein
MCLSTICGLHGDDAKQLFPLNTILKFIALENLMLAQGMSNLLNPNSTRVMSKLTSFTLAHCKQDKLTRLFSLNTIFLKFIALFYHDSFKKSNVLYDLDHDK